MFYLESDNFDPYYNLALEEHLFSALPAGSQCLMLWQNQNAIVVGRFQNTAEEIDQSYVDVHRIRVARRLSGGGAVYHDLGNLNYTIITDQTDIEALNFRYFVYPVLAVLKGFGVEAEFSGRNDLTIAGKKFSGNSQYASEGRLLHHGCIMLSSNLEAVSAAFRVRDAKFQSKSIKSVSSRVTSINDHAPFPIRMDVFKRSLAEAVLAGKPVSRYVLTEKDIQEVERLRRDKYSTWEWNYGFFGDYEMCRERRFPSGTVAVSMNVRDAHVQNIRFSGDFFGNGDIRELEKALTGLPLDARLRTVLDHLKVSDYLSGITAEDLYALLMY